ncbi:hypothetical protein [Nocardioides mangrovi]|uniref:Serine/threonine protein kinase n=1 Tax=Nocardioides mangrovi TaxID=2874580 RepID=A0ABS7UA51_9ACTN|nr:hypothetical protein [Nocardioides mangrovi]MBZ5737601.1 hypothetical protein [Nocardioides mangrovi]
MSEQYPTAPTATAPSPPPSYPPYQPPPVAPRVRDRRLALPWVATVAVVALLVGGGLGFALGYVAHGDGGGSSFQRGPGGFPGGGTFPGGGQVPGNGQQAPGGQVPQQPGS